ncbi:FAD-dependent oxidoreductase [Pantoea sp. CCBC3-3-1]|uniref:FAD-dependent oxidoreductase n=1 Tax=Pantoea sp. CCBC3-3-1 TaxID=2490851 RepID=UPI0011BFA925|nr:FAD-dependent oxidoreductase [Pantoea sp. CCBC3-3-1]
MMSTFIIIGGGPAAAIEAARLSAMGKDVTMISEQYGGCMDIMGNRRLQSYCNELVLKDSDKKLEDYMKEPALTPTGLEYGTYVRDVIESLPVRKICGRVSYFTRDLSGFRCQVMVGDDLKYYYSDNLVLATGISSKTTPAVFSLIDPIDCFNAYKMFMENPSSITTKYRNIVILGGGNTAFQLADASASLGFKTTILARSYIGLFPQETQDRFALRAPSQITIERIWKSQTDKNITPLGFHVYSSLCADNNSLTANLLKENNTDHIALLSYENVNCPTIKDGIKSVTFEKSDTLFISAIGTTGVIPENSFIQININSKGYVDNTDGKTDIKGLYVAGMIAGAKSINTMKLTEYEL